MKEKSCNVKSGHELRDRIMKYIYLLIFMFCLYPTSYASHIQGADLSYTYIGNNQYRFLVNLYRDCTSAVTLNSNVTITSTLTGSFGQCSQNSSAGTISSQMTLLSGPTEVSQLCASELANSNCNGGTQPGTQKYVLEKILTLNFTGCGSNGQWRVGFSFAARNTSITNLQNPGATDLYIEAVIKQAASVGSNSSPTFSVLPVPYVCVFQPAVYSQGAVDAEGDSLRFTSINPLAANAAPALYQGGFSPTSPLTTTTGFTVNPNSGQLSYTPNAMQVAVITLLVEEFRNGVLISSTIRDLQVIVRNCSGVNPNPPTSTNPINIVGGTLTGNTITVCQGTPISFQFTASDPDAGTQLIVTDDHSSSIPAATVNYSGSGNNVSGTFSWTPTAGDIGTNVFSVTVADNACPISAISVFSYIIYVSNCTTPCPSTVTSAPSPICNTTSLNLTTLQVTTQPGTWSIVSTPTGSNPATIAGATFNAVGRDPGNYIIRFTLNNPQSGCPAFSEQTLVVNSATAAIAPATASACAGAPVTLTASGGGTYSWNTGTNTAAITVNPAVNTTYTVTVTATNGCTATASRTVTISTGPTASISPATASVCSGGSVTLTASGGTSYAWSNGTNTAANTVSPALNTTYTVTVTDAGNCTATASRTVTVSNAITATIAPANPSVCVGSSTTITASGGTVFIWSNGANTATNTVSPTLNTNYTVTVTDGGNCSATASVSVSINALPTAVISPAVATVCAGENITLTASGGTSYAWSNGTNTAVNSVSPLTNTTYTVTITDASNCTATASRLVSVTPDVTFSALLINPSCGNSNGSVTITPISAGTTTYSWSTNANTGNNATAANLSAGVYDVTVTQNGCSVDTALILNSGSTLAVALTNAVNPTCAGSDGSINVTLSGGTAPYTVTIDTGGIPFTINLPVAVSQTISNLSAVIVSVSVTDFAGCQTTASATLTAPANCCTFSISAIISQASCGNADGAIAVSATNGSGNYTYVWSANANTGNSSSAANLSASVYSLTVTDNGFANCFLDTFFSVSNPNAPVISSVTVINETCPGTADGSISITAAGGTGIFSYTWSANASIGNVATATGLGSGVYNYTVTDAANCVATGSSTVQSGFCCSLQTNATVTQTSCGLSNGSIDISVLSGGQPNYSYSINGGASQAGNVFTNLSGGAYIVITTDNNNCKDTISVTVNQSSNNMSLTVTGIDPTCFGATDGSATAVVYGNTGNVSWNWSNQQITPAISGLTAGSYTVTATDVNTCTASGSATISQPAPLSLYIGNDTVVCSSLPYLITAPSGYTAYNWSNGATSESVSISNSGSYSLVVTNANGCTTADNVNVQFGSSAGLSAGPDAELYYGTSLGLFPVVTGSSSGSFLWSPAEGLSCTDCKNPVANPLQTTAYQLTYTDENGCVVADTLVLTVLPQGVAFFPTAFSPNGDGNNDTFHVLGSQIRNYNISIYNRWGEKVFTSNNIAEGWDGTYKEVEQPMGVYIYYASVIFMQNETRQFKGSITLIR